MKSAIINLLTLGAWVIMGISIIWLIIVISSSLYFSLAFQDIYIPKATRFTALCILLIIGWSIIVFLGSLVWQWYRGLNHKQERKLATYESKLHYKIGETSWSEASISISSNHFTLEESRDVIRDNLIVKNEKRDERIPCKLLNQATCYMNQGQYLKSLSMLRLILNHPDTTEIEIKIVQIKLSKCCDVLGYKHFVEGLA